MILTAFKETNIDYKKYSLLIGFPKCSGKCWKELGMNPEICQNEALKNNLIEISDDSLENKINNVIESRLIKSIVFGGLEPFETFEDMIKIIKWVNTKIIKENISDFDIVIYTGYYKNEVREQLEEIVSLNLACNVIVKFGRFIMNVNSVYDGILGITLASYNQYAEIIYDKNKSAKENSMHYQNHTSILTMESLE